MTTLKFDATNVDPTPSFDPIPAGVYIAQVIESDVKPTKSGTGEYLQLTLEILDGQFKGRRCWDRINIRNQSAEAETIGQKQLSQLCHAIGVLQVQDSAQLHAKPMRVKVTVRKDPNFGDSNEIKGYEAVAGAAAPAAAATAAPAKPAGVTPPWQQKRATA